MAFRESGKSSDPDAVLLAQSRPGQISSRRRGAAARPFASDAAVGLSGPWCEGEGRTGRPWPGVVRVPWRDWRWRLPRELGLGDEKLSTAARLPRTATETDRLQQSIANLQATDSFGNVELVTTSRTTFDAWRAALAVAWSSLRLHDIQQLAYHIADIELQMIDGWDNVSAANASTSSALNLQPCARILSAAFSAAGRH